MTKNNTITLNMGLCEGRHEIPQVTDGYIFPSEVNPTNVHKLGEIAFNKLKDFYFENDRLQLNLYVTGLTVALVSVLNACRLLDPEFFNLKVTLYHYDRDTNSYYPQEVI